MREGTGSFNRFKSWLGLRSEFDVFSGQQRFFATAEIRARTDKFYLIEFEKGPLGGYPQGTHHRLRGDPTYVRHQEIHDEVRFTAQFGKTFGNWFQVRGGLKESTFGFGADVLARRGPAQALDGHLRLVHDDAAPQARRRARSVPLGVPDCRRRRRAQHARLPRHRPGQHRRSDAVREVRFGRDYFLGGSLHFDDKDLAVLLRVYGALLVAML